MSPETSVKYPQAFGLCAGVDVAIDLAYEATGLANSANVQVLGYHAVVHNAVVTTGLESAGMRFIDDTEAIESGSLVVVSAHGAGPEVFSDIYSRGAQPVDATCPFVTHTHKTAMRAREEEAKVIYVCHGKPGENDKPLHDEVAGMVGHLDGYLDDTNQLHHDPVDRAYLELAEPPSPSLLGDQETYYIVTQTTLHAAKSLAYIAGLTAYIKKHQPNARVITSPRGYVCTAVADRQAGVEQLVELMPRSLVVATDPTSKNGNGYVDQARLLVTASGQDTTVYAVANAAEAAALSLEGSIGLTASASTPTETIQEIAEVFGESTVPKDRDRAFHLPDARPGVIAAKLEKLTGHREI